MICLNIKIWIIWSKIGQIWVIFTHLKLWFALARHNSKWVKIQIRLLCEKRVEGAAMRVFSGIFQWLRDFWVAHLIGLNASSILWPCHCILAVCPPGVLQVWPRSQRGHRSPYGDCTPGGPGAWPLVPGAAYCFPLWGTPAPLTPLPVPFPRARLDTGIEPPVPGTDGPLTDIRGTDTVTPAIARRRQVSPNGEMLSLEMGSVMMNMMP